MFDLGILRIGFGAVSIGRNIMLCIILSCYIVVGEKDRLVPMVVVSPQV